MGAGDDLDERRFSSAVLPHEGMDLANAELERHLLERPHARKRFRDVSQNEHIEIITRRRGCGGQSFMIFSAPSRLRVKVIFFWTRPRSRSLLSYRAMSRRRVRFAAGNS